jgi:hypothetical protein
VDEDNKFEVSFVVEGAKTPEEAERSIDQVLASGTLRGPFQGGEQLVGRRVFGMNGNVVFVTYTFQPPE